MSTCSPAFQGLLLADFARNISTKVSISLGRVVMVDVYIRFRNRMLTGGNRDRLSVANGVLRASPW